MSLNNLGLGFLFSAKDLASGVMGDVKKHLLDVEGAGSKAAKGIGESLAQFGTGLAIMGTGIAGLAILDPAVEAAKTFGKQMRLVSTIADEATFPMEEMKGLVDDLGVQFGLAPVEEAKSLYQAIQSGAKDAATATRLMMASNQLAAGTQTDLGASMSTVSQVARTFGIDLSHSVAIADSLFTAAKHVQGGISEMSGMIEMVGPTAAAAGLSMNDLLGTMAQMDAAGMKGRHAVAALQEILTTIIKPSDEARAEAMRLGVAFDDATRKSEGLPALLQDIADKGGLNQQSLEKLFGSTQAATAAMALMRDGGEGLDSMMKRLASSQGAAAEAAAKMGSPEQQFNAALDALATKIGESLMPLRKEVFTFFRDMVDHLRETNPAILGFATQVFLAGALALVAIGAFMAFAAALPLLSAGFMAASAAAWELATAIGAAIWPVLPFVAAAALAIAMFKVAFDNNFGGIADVAREVYADVSLVFESLAELFSGGGFTEDTWQKLEAHSGIRNFVLSVYGWVSRLENFFSGIGKGFEGALGMFEPMFGTIGRAIESLLDAFSNLAGPQGADGAARAFDTFGAVGEMIGVILGGLSPIVATAINVIIMALHLVVAQVVGAFGFVRSLFSGLVDMFLGLGELLTGIVHGNLGQVWHGFKMMAFGAIDGVIGMLLSLVGIFAGVIDSIAGLFGKKLNLQGDLTGFRDSMHDQMAKDFGVDKATGLRAENRTEATPGLASFASPPPPDSPLASFGTPAMSLAGAPGIAAAGGAPAGGGLDFGAMAAHLDQISKNTSEGGPPINVTVMLDAEVVGKATSKAKKSSDTRSFTPAPMPE